MGLITLVRYVCYANWVNVCLNSLQVKVACNKSEHARLSKQKKSPKLMLNLLQTADIFSWGTLVMAVRSEVIFDMRRLCFNPVLGVLALCLRWVVLVVSSPGCTGPHWSKNRSEKVLWDKRRNVFKMPKEKQNKQCRCLNLDN